MRDRQDIEREMFSAREDLEQSVNELKHAIAEKFEIRARAHHAVDQRVDRVKDRVRGAARRSLDRGREVIYRSRDGAIVYFHKASDGARRHKVLLAGILGGLVALTLAAVFIRRRRHRHWLISR